MGLRKGESLIQYKQGLFSRIKNTIVSLFSTDDKDEQKTANVGHDRLHDVLMQDRIKNNDIRVAKAENKIPESEKISKEISKDIDSKVGKIVEEIVEEQASIKSEKTKQTKEVEEKVVEEKINEIVESKLYSDENKSAKGDIEELLKVLNILNENKVDTKKIKTYKSVNKHRKATILKDIKQTDIDINKIIADNKLMSDYPIGRKIELARRRINNIDKYRREITKEQIAKLETLGIIK
jgi:hypothetical protein